MMNKVDCKEWNLFKISDIFETEYIGKQLQVPTGAYVSKKNLTEGSVPRITVSGMENGVSGYYDSCDKNYRVFENFISISFLGTIFYQKSKASLDMKVHCLKPKKVVLNDAIAFFLATIIKKTITNSKYSDQISSTILPNIDTLLPSIKNDDNTYTPDWQYMEQYIDSIKQVVEQKFSKIKQIKEDKNIINTKEWKEFKIGELFPNIVKPDVLHSREIIQDENGIPYVVRSKFNNGIKCYAQYQLKMKPSPSGTISFGAENATFFYQSQKFISGRDIYYIDTTKYSKKICFFIISCLKTLSDKYSYNYGMFPNLLKEDIIKLPIDKDGNPDWQYMEDYISTIENKVKNTIKNLSKQ